MLFKLTVAGGVQLFMSLKFYNQYINNILSQVEGYKPLELSQTADLSKVASITKDLDDLMFMDSILHPQQTNIEDTSSNNSTNRESTLFRSYSFLDEPVITSTIDYLKSIIDDEDIAEEVIINMGSLADDNYEISPEAIVNLSNQGVSTSVDFMADFQQEVVQQGVLSSISDSIVNGDTPDELTPFDPDSPDFEESDEDELSEEDLAYLESLSEEDTEDEGYTGDDEDAEFELDEFEEDEEDEEDDGEGFTGDEDEEEFDEDEEFENEFDEDEDEPFDPDSDDFEDTDTGEEEFEDEDEFDDDEGFTGDDEEEEFEDDEFEDDDEDEDAEPFDPDSEEFEEDEFDEDDDDDDEDEGFTGDEEDEEFEEDEFDEDDDDEPFDPDSEDFEDEDEYPDEFEEDDEPFDPDSDEFEEDEDYPDEFEEDDDDEPFNPDDEEFEEEDEFEDDDDDEPYDPDADEEEDDDEPFSFDEDDDDEPFNPDDEDEDAEIEDKDTKGGGNSGGKQPLFDFSKATMATTSTSNNPFGADPFAIPQGNTEDDPFSFDTGTETPVEPQQEKPYVPTSNDNLAQGIIKLSDKVLGVPNVVAGLLNRKKKGTQSNKNTQNKRN